MIEFGWILVSLLLVSFIFLVISIFTIRGTFNSSTSKQEIGMIPLYIVIILLFIASILASYVVFKDKEVSICRMPYSGQKVQALTQPTYSAPLTSTIN